MTEEQKELREAVATICGGNYIAADAAIAVVLNMAADVLEKRSEEAIDDSEAGGCYSAAETLRELIPASGDAQKETGA